jgi:hypothetical protein
VRIDSHGGRQSRGLRCRGCAHVESEFVECAWGQRLAPRAVASPPPQPKPHLLTSDTHYDGAGHAEHASHDAADVEHAATFADPLDDAAVAAYDGYLYGPRIVRRQAGSRQHRRSFRNCTEGRDR